MSRDFRLLKSSKKLYFQKNNNNNANIGQKSKKYLKKKSYSQSKYFPVPDIITQLNPYLNINFNNRIKDNKIALTPNNHSRILKEEYLLPEKEPEYINKKTLVLDLDETLVHSSFTPFEINDIILNVDFDGIIYNIYVLVRPGTEYFIKNISKYYEVVIFTASLSNYASPLLDLLDPENNIKYRLYRENCTFMNGIYVKDLKKLNRNLKDLIIVDNSPLAYSFDIENGLPIKTWYEDKNDIELYKINSILEFLANTNDVRNYIKKFVKRNEINYEEAMNIIKSLNNGTNNTSNNSVSNNNTSYLINNISTKINIAEENSKNIENEKNMMNNKHKNTKNKNNLKRTLKATILYNAQKKKNIFPLYDFNLKKKTMKENKKINEKPKNNFFRYRKKNELNTVNKIKPIISSISPTIISTSSIKNIFSNNTTKNKIIKQNNFFNNFHSNNSEIKLKDNYIKLILEKKEKNKYAIIMNQINKNKNMLKSKLRISSSIISHRNFSPLNLNKRNKAFISLNPQRSKSIGHFFNKNKEISPKTPDVKLNNFLGGLYLGNTTRYNKLDNNLIDYKYRRVQTAKKINYNYI